MNPPISLVQIQEHGACAKPLILEPYRLFSCFFQHFFQPQKQENVKFLHRVIPEGDVPMKKLIQLCWA